VYWRFKKKDSNKEKVTTSTSTTTLGLARIVEACYKYCKPLKSLVLLALTFFYLFSSTTARRPFLSKSISHTWMDRVSRVTYSVFIGLSISIRIDRNENQCRLLLAKIKGNVESETQRSKRKGWNKMVLRARDGARYRHSERSVGLVEKCERTSKTPVLINPFFLFYFYLLKCSISSALKGHWIIQ